MSHQRIKKKAQTLAQPTEELMVDQAIGEGQRQQPKRKWRRIDTQIKRRLEQYESDRSDSPDRSANDPPVDEYFGDSSGGEDGDDIASLGNGSPRDGTPERPSDTGRSGREEIPGILEGPGGLKGPGPRGTAEAGSDHPEGHGPAAEDSGEAVSADEDDSPDADTDEAAPRHREGDTIAGRTSEGAKPSAMEDPKGQAFAKAFAKIIHKKVKDESMGPILAGKQKLLAKRIEAVEEEAQKKLELAKQRRELTEVGHVVPEAHTSAKERTLIKLGTRGVVCLFNAVSKAQQLTGGRGGGTSRSGSKPVDKVAFLAELRNVALAAASVAGASPASAGASHGGLEGTTSIEAT